MAARFFEPDNWRWREGPVDPGSAIVFDMDGVLSDATSRQHFIERPWRDWEAFFEACGDDPLIDEVARLLGVGTAETVRKWVRQGEVDAGQRPGATTEESAELKRLRRENAELKRANSILKAASTFFAAELDRPHH